MMLVNVLAWQKPTNAKPATVNWKFVQIAHIILSLLCVISSKHSIPSLVY
jgi:hypothetical protein